MIGLLKRFLASEVEHRCEAYRRFGCLLLDAVGRHAIQGDTADYENFRADIGELAKKLENRPSPSDVMVLAGTAIKTLEAYNEDTARFIRSRGVELQAMVSMLAQTVTSISTGSERSASRLETIRKQLEKASMMEDIRNLKAHLGQCLDGLRDETLHRREEWANMVDQLKRQVEHSREHVNGVGPTAGIDPLTRLPERAEAQAALEEALRQREPLYGVVFVIDRLPTINAHHGYAVGDEVLIFCRRHLGERLSAGDRIYRWSGASFLVLLARPEATPQDVEEEIKRLTSRRLEENFTIGLRTVFLHIKYIWSVFSLHEFYSPNELCQRIDAVVAGNIHTLPASSGSTSPGT